MQWIDVPGVPADPDTSINRGLGLPNGTFHFAFRCDSMSALEVRRRDQIDQGVLVGELLDPFPCRLFFFNNLVNGRRQIAPRVYRRPQQPIVIHCSGSFRPAWRCSSRRADLLRSRSSLFTDITQSGIIDPAVEKARTLIQPEGGAPATEAVLQALTIDGLPVLCAGFRR